MQEACHPARADKKQSLGVSGLHRGVQAYTARTLFARASVVLAKAGLTHKDVGLFLFTQVNLSTIKEVMKGMNLPMSRTHTVMQKWGYTGSACIPTVLDDAVHEGKLKPGDTLVMCASGGGLNMACTAFRW
ncbi:MAG TPA: 3-oxoacyl-[acyl-carrier-protein] synthase III C-terminal domain-containing protein [Pyrinomonadaceae bacterium]|nr:3-oxoacyl-[acyl-carrier-protein] synthase III C-terminal domain-containing protein [Pyrinomonadaceae bacterium]